MPRTTALLTTTYAGAAALLLVVLTACGGGGGPTSAAVPSANAPQQNPPAQPGGPARFPGASGQVAAISGSTLQVQSAQTGQVAVTYTDTTTVTKTVSATASDITVGSCVQVRGADVATSTANDPVTAASVQVSPAVDGECGPGGMTGGGAMRPGGARPSGRPGGGTQSDGPGAGQGAGGGGPMAGRPTSGEVTAVDGATITVAAVTFGGRGGGADDTAGAPATPSTSPVMVTTTSSTTYTKTVSGSTKDLAVGQCVTALGEADDTGALTASSIASQPAVDGECSTGFGARSSTGGAP